MALRIPQNPKQCVRYLRQEANKYQPRNVLERANEVLASKQTDKLRWLHPTKGLREMTHRRARAGLRYNVLMNGYPFHLYVRRVARGDYKKGAI